MDNFGEKFDAYVSVNIIKLWDKVLSVTKSEITWDTQRLRVDFVIVFWTNVLDNRKKTEWTLKEQDSGI